MAMHPEILKKNGSMSSLTVGLREKSRSYQDVACLVPSHAEPSSPTKLATNVGKGSSIPTVSMACKDAYDLQPEPRSRHGYWADKECGSLEPTQFKIGNMNPFKAYIVSRESGEQSSALPRQGRATYHWKHTAFHEREVLNPIHVVHKSCPTGMDTPVLNSDESAQLTSYDSDDESSLGPQAPQDEMGFSSSEDDFDDGLCQSLGGTNETIPFALLPPDSPRLPGVYGAHERNCLTHPWGTDDTTCGDSSPAALYSDETCVSPKGSTSAFPGVTDNEPSSSYAPWPQFPHRKSCSHGGTSYSMQIAPSLLTQSALPVGYQQGRDVGFGRITGRGGSSMCETNITPMGSESINEAWDNLFEDCTTAPNGSVKTCLTSWEYFFPKEVQEEGYLRDGSCTPESYDSLSEPSTVGTTILGSSPRTVDTVSRWSLCDDMLNEYPPRQRPVHGVPPLVFDRSSEADYFSGANRPRHAPGRGAFEEAKPSTFVGDDFRNAFYASQFLKQKGLVWRHDSRGVSTKMDGECCPPPGKNSTPVRSRFSVSLDTGYPSPTEGAKVHCPDKKTPRKAQVHGAEHRSMPVKKWRSMISSLGALCGCFREDDEVDSPRSLEDVDELPEGYREYIQSKGSKHGRGSTKSHWSLLRRRSTGQKQSPSVKLLNHLKRTSSMDSQTESSHCTSSPRSFWLRLRRGHKNKDVDNGISEGQEQEARRSHSSDYRYSQRHKFLVDKIQQQDFTLNRPRSAQD